MNINEECLLLFLNNPGRLEFTTKELTKFIFSGNKINKEAAAETSLFALETVRI